MKIVTRILVYAFIFALCNYEFGILLPTIIVLFIEIKEQKNRLKKILGKVKGNDLFNGDDFIFKKYVREVEFYGEHGIGESTLWVLRNTKAKILAAETSSEWVQKFQLDNQSKN